MVERLALTGGHGGERLAEQHELDDLHRSRRAARRLARHRRDSRNPGGGEDRRIECSSLLCFLRVPEKRNDLLHGLSCRDGVEGTARPRALIQDRPLRAPRFPPIVDRARAASTSAGRKFPPCRRTGAYRRAPVSRALTRALSRTASLGKTITRSPGCRPASTSAFSPLRGPSCTLRSRARLPSTTNVA